MQTGKGKQIVHVNPPTFSLTELSIMMKILATIEFERNEKGLNVYDIQLDIFNRIVEPIVEDVDLTADDRVVHSLRTKIGKVYTLRLLFIIETRPRQDFNSLTALPVRPLL